MWPRKPDHDDMVIYGDGSYGRVVEDPFPPGTLAYLQPHEYPDAERLERIRSIIPESALSDYDVTEPAQGRPVFTDRATGLQYLRDDSDPLLAPNPRNTGITTFCVDAGGRLHYLRPRGPRAPEEVTVLVTSVDGRQPSLSECKPPLSEPAPPPAPAMAAPTSAYSLYPPPRPPRDPRDTEPDAALFAAVGVKSQRRTHEHP